MSSHTTKSIIWSQETFVLYISGSSIDLPVVQIYGLPDGYTLQRKHLNGGSSILSFIIVGGRV